MPWASHHRTTGDYLTPAQRATVLAAHHRVCHLCGHPEAEQVDHITPWAEWTRTDSSPHHPSNLAPAHGQPCPTCQRECHSDKTKAEQQAGSQRAQAKLKHPVGKHPGLL